MYITENYYIIISKKTPHTYLKDFRLPRVIADDNILYYRTGDVITKIIDAYKFEDENNANDYLNKYIKPLEDYEVRKVNISFFII